MKRFNFKKFSFMVVFLVLSLLVVSACSKPQSVVDDSEIADSIDDEDYGDTEDDDDEDYELSDEYIGVYLVSGYAKSKKFSCGKSKCEYLFFVVLNSDDQRIYELLEDWEGNSFVRKDAIGIGCVEDGQLVFDNSSDAFGFESYELSKEATALILAATKEKPITIKLERLEYTDGTDAPKCYTHLILRMVIAPNLPDNLAESVLVD